MKLDRSRFLRIAGVSGALLWLEALNVSMSYRLGIQADRFGSSTGPLTGLEPIG